MVLSISGGGVIIWQAFCDAAGFGDGWEGNLEWEFPPKHPILFAHMDARGVVKLPPEHLRVFGYMDDRDWSEVSTQAYQTL